MLSVFGVILSIRKHKQMLKNKNVKYLKTNFFNFTKFSF